MRIINSIFFKLFFTFILFSVVPLSFVGGIAYKKYSDNLFEYLDYHASDNLDQKIKSISSFMNDLERMEMGITQSKIFSGFLTNTNPNNHSYYFLQLDELLNSIQNIRPETVGITIISNNGFMYNYGYSLNLTYSKEDFINLPWMKDILHNTSYSPHITKLHVRPYSNTDKNQYVYSYVKKVWDRKLKSDGFLIIDFKMTEIKNILSNQSDSSKNVGSFVFDHNGYVLPPDGNVDFEYKSLETAPSGSTLKSTNGQEFIIFKKQFPKTNWYVTEFFEKDVFYQPVHEIKKIAIVVVMTSALICLFASLFISHKISKPIRNLQRVMKQVESGNLEETFVVQSKDELGDLGRGFNKMIIEIKKLIQSVKQEEKLKKEAEITALQLQINPHFIYNTLETINSLARKKREHDISHLIVLLGRLLRLSISSFEEKIPIKQEIDYIGYYLEIQKARMREPFEYAIDIDPKIEGCLSVKWILQPIVENAIIHGIETLKAEGRLEIFGETKDSAIVFTIKDNGKGIDALKLEQIRYQLQHNSADLAKYMKKIGLYNVQTRINAHYGKPFGIQIASEITKGTTVTITIPKEEPR